MMRRLRSTLDGLCAVLVAASLTSACTRQPARIAFATDTLVINSLVPAATGAIALSSAGDSIRSAAFVYEMPSSTAMRLNDDHTVSCIEDGVGAVTVSAGAARATLPVRCHLIRGFGLPHGFELLVGGPPVPLLIDARDKEGRTLRSARFPLIIDDTNVVQLKDGMLKGLKIGRAWISAAGIKTSVPTPRIGVEYVTVSEQVVGSNDIAIADGDSLVLALAPGSYILSMDFDAGTAERGISTSWPGTYCPSVPPAPEHRLVCLVRPEAQNPRLVLRNTAPGNPTAQIRGSVQLRRSV